MSINHNDIYPYSPANFRTAYDRDMRLPQNTEGESLTQQQFKEETDVNNIMAKYKKTGQISHLNKHQGNFGDFSSVGDYQSALERLMTAQSSFDTLPSELRTRFQNDPGQLIAYLEDEKNREESYQLGLRVRPPQKPENIQESFEKALENHEKKRTKKSE